MHAWRISYGYANGVQRYCSLSFSPNQNRQFVNSFNPYLPFKTFNHTEAHFCKFATQQHIMHLRILFLVLVLLAYSTVATATDHTNVLRSLETAPVLHFTLTRRGGKFAPTESGRDYVNLTYLAQELDKTEARFNLTQRQVQGNKLVRKAKDLSVGGKEEGELMGEVAEDGKWYAPLVFTII